MISSFASARLRARRSSSGFTLIELMIVAAIIAILSAMAMYAYSGYVARAKRADARNQLMQAAQFMQQFYSANDSFTTDHAGNPVLSQIPRNLQQSPADGTPIYSLTVTQSVAPAPVGYTLSMTPVTPGSMATDMCGAFILDSKGVRTIGNTSANRDTCWK